MTAVASTTRPQVGAGPAAASCRGCDAPLNQLVIDLGMSPLCESILPMSALNSMEPFYPLIVYVCMQCYLVQLEEYVSPEAIFSDYAYFSSYSQSWLEHCQRYTAMIAERLGLNEDSFVVELGSNDGYLLQHFAERRIPVLGIEPARNVAQAAMNRGIPTITEFFGTGLAASLAASGQQGDLVIGNNVLAQVPDLRDFIAGVSTVLHPTGTATFEFPHLLRLLQDNQFDTIYHEHFSYFSALALEPRLAEAGLRIVDVEELATHGGSLRIYVQHDSAGIRISDRVTALREAERAAGLDSLAPYAAFRCRVEQAKRNLLGFLGAAKNAGASIVGYGAPGKGNTLLNYCGIRTDYLDYTVDRSPHKHGMFLPGTHIPIYDPDHIFRTRPDYVLVLPWNLKDEILQQMSGIRDWRGKFIIPIPDVEIVP